MKVIKRTVTTWIREDSEYPQKLVKFSVFGMDRPVSPDGSSGGFCVRKCRLVIVGNGD